MLLSSSTPTTHDEPQAEARCSHSPRSRPPPAPPRLLGLQAGPEWSQVVRAATLEAASSSTRGAGLALGVPGQPEPPGAP